MIVLGMALIGSVMPAPARGEVGAVFTMTNAAGANAVVRYSRSADGTLGQPQFYPTGGSGNGAGLGSQEALALGDGGRWLIAVNAGSNDLTVFSAKKDGLQLTGRQASGGVMPVSIALHGDLVFVLNAGGAANITGFRLSPAGDLVPIAGSTRVLPGAAPAQVSFANNGTTLVVTEKASNTITVYTLQGTTVSGPITHPSSGLTPFGFGISRMDLLIVSDAAGGAPAASTVSSYLVDDSGTLQPVTAALPIGQTAACWVAVTQNGKYAYVANTGSSTISSIGVARDGALKVLNPAAGRTPPGTPVIDLALSTNSHYLYALAGGTISVFRVSPDGGLTSAQVVTGLPPSTAGLVAR
jgi:6-phosphogluconolactonase (cycloisomerase 2 family)